MHKPQITPARVLLPIGLGTALSLMGDATLYAVLPTHASLVGISLAQVGVMLGINRAVRLVSNGTAGLVYDRFPRRWIFIPALFLGAFSSAIYAISRGFWPLLIGRLLWGISWSGIWVGGTTMILDVTSELDRGKWSGLYQVWFFFGTATGAMLGGGLTDLLGYYSTMWVCAIITGVGALATWILLPETRPDLQRTGSLLKGNAGIKPKTALVNWLHKRRQPIPFIRQIDKIRFSYVVCLRGINRFIMSGILSATLGLIVRDQLNFENITVGVATFTGILMAGRTLMSMLGAIIAGLSSDYVRNRWIVLACGLGLSVGGMLLLSSQMRFILIVGIGLAAMARGGIQSLTTSLTGDLVPQFSRGRAVGALHTVGDFGSAIGPSIAYYLLPVWGLSSIFIICAAIFGLSLVTEIMLIKTGQVVGNKTV